MSPLGHASIAYLTGTILARNLDQFPMNAVVFGVTAGGVALDLDITFRFVQKGIKVFDGTIGQHRFFPTHTPAFAFLLSLLISAISRNFAIFFLLGTLLHLLIDTLFFAEGIMFFYPFSKKSYRFLTIKTHKFWAPKRISQVNDWWKNYFSSRLFFVVEIIPATIAAMLLLGFI